MDGRQHAAGREPRVGTLADDGTRVTLGPAADKEFATMNFWQWISGRRQETAAEVATRVVMLVSESVRPLVERRIVNMSTPEARGYVRARTGHLIREAIEIVTAHHPPSRRLKTEDVLAVTLDQLLRALQRRPAYAPIRRAA
jgi:hypothetical protein